MGSIGTAVSTAIIMLALCFSEASGQYEEEIERYVADPCLLITVIYEDLDTQFGGMTEAIAIVRAGLPDATLAGMVTLLTPMLRGKSVEQRKAIYAIALLSCLEGGVLGAE